MLYQLFFFFLEQCSDYETAYYCDGNPSGCACQSTDYCTYKMCIRDRNSVDGVLPDKEFQNSFTEFGESFTLNKDSAVCEAREVSEKGSSEISADVYKRQGV